MAKNIKNNYGNSCEIVKKFLSLDIKKEGDTRSSSITNKN